MARTLKSLILHWLNWLLLKPAGETTFSGVPYELAVKKSNINIASNLVTLAIL